LFREERLDEVEEAASDQRRRCPTLTHWIFLAITSS
jgi:hypothetical protein